MNEKNYLNDVTKKKPVQKDLAEYLGVTQSAISRYNPKKRYLMMLGLEKLKELKEKDGRVK